MDRTDIESYIDEIRAELTDAGNRLEEAEMIQNQALADIAELLAKGDGLLPRSEMAKLAKIARNRTYRLYPETA